MDPLMGIAGALMVSNWSVGLLRSTSGILLDKQAPNDMRIKVIESIRRDEEIKVVDLHLWSIGPSIYSAIVSVVGQNLKPPQYYKAKIPADLKIVHLTIECQAERR